MSEEDLENRIKKWLGQQGYPLEMQVARAFQEAGFSVSSSEYFLDPDENKPREIDVIASMQEVINGVIFQLVYTVECKSSKTNPWVCFCSATSQTREPSVGFLARHATAQGRDMLTELSCNPDVRTGHLFHLPDHHAYGVTNAFKKRLDVPYQSIHGARKAAQAIVTHYDREQALPNRVGTVCIAFPLVVVNAPIFSCTLDDKGKIELLKVNSETILRTGFDTYYSVVEIVDATGLPTYLKSKANLMARFLRRLPERIPGTLEQLDIANMTKE